MRVALLNCYLQGGHTENAEVESSARFVEAAWRLGIEARVFARSEDIAAFEPDFVLSLSYNDAKLAGFPTYILLTAPPRWFDALPRFRRNVLTYDGYWTVSPSVSRHVGELYAKAGKPDLGAFAAISYFRTEFVPLDFSRAFAAYIGTNWDGNRHADLFRALAPLGATRFYGKRERWAHLPAEALGGEVAFDGRAALETYRAAGIGLCLGHADFDADGIPTSRTFEVPAASAVMIAARNALVEEAFGNAVLYVDTGAPESAAAAIRDHVEWVRAHPKQALAMAEAGHRVFIERFALEALLANAVEMHRRACRTLGFSACDDRVGPADDAGGFGATVVIAVRDATFGRLARCLDSVFHQTLPARRVIVLDGTSGGEARAALRAHEGAQLMEHRRVGRGTAGFATQLARAWDRIAGEWVCCITPDEMLYPNHLFAAAEAVKRHRARHGAPPAIVHSGVVQRSEADELPELMHDYYNVPRAEHMRLAQFDFQPAWTSATRLPLHPASLMLHAPSIAEILAGRRLPKLFPPALARRLRALARSGGIVFTASPTLATASSRCFASYGEFSFSAG